MLHERSHATASRKAALKSPAKAQSYRVWALGMAGVFPEQPGQAPDRLKAQILRQACGR